jgi:hypothetical protein
LTNLYIKLVKNEYCNLNLIVLEFIQIGANISDTGHKAGMGIESQQKSRDAAKTAPLLSLVHALPLPFL